MKFSLAKFFLLLLLGAILIGISGCATDDPENMSVRPWNEPQGWENGLGGMDYQHH